MIKIIKRPPKVNTTTITTHGASAPPKNEELEHSVKLMEAIFHEQMGEVCPLCGQTIK